VSERMRVVDLDTPALLVDLDRMESNLRRMAGYFARGSAKLRPHFKAHQVLSLATRQVQAGAIGITCARLSQAEALVGEGIRNVLIASEIAGERLIRRFVKLSRLALVIVVVDDSRVVADMARFAGSHAKDLNVVVNLETGLRRSGVAPGECAVALARKVLAAGLNFRGLMGYSGTVQLPPGPEKTSAVRAALRPLMETKSMIEREGIPVEMITCGGASDCAVSGAFPGVTENQAGSYLLMDTGYAPFAPDFLLTLTVLTTVVSKTAGERIVADAGMKALSSAKGLPSLKGAAGLHLRALHAEHALIDLLDPSAPVDIGDKIEIWVHHLDSTLPLYDRMWGVRNGEVESILTITR